MEEFDQAGKKKAGNKKAIGLSNCCPFSIEGVMKTATVTPGVNQVHYHAGMGSTAAQFFMNVVSLYIFNFLSTFDTLVVFLVFGAFNVANILFVVFMVKETRGMPPGRRHQLV